MSVPSQPRSPYAALPPASFTFTCAHARAMRAPACCLRDINPHLTLTSLSPINRINRSHPLNSSHPPGHRGPRSVFVMKAPIKYLLCGIALGVTAFVNAAPSAMPSPDLLPINITLPLSKSMREIYGNTYLLLIYLADGTLDDTVSAFGYDPSKDYHEQSTIEVWTQAMYLLLFGRLLIAHRFGPEDRAVDPSTLVMLAVTISPRSSPEHCCALAAPSGATTAKTMVGRPLTHPISRYRQQASYRAAHTVSTSPQDLVYTILISLVRTVAAEWANDEIRRMLINLVGSILYAYTTTPTSTNCYEVPGQGRFCNIPQLIRVSERRCRLHCNV